MASRRYVKGMRLINVQTKQYVLFGMFNSTGDVATCLDKAKRFVQIPRETLDSDYVTHGELEKRAKEKRRGQAW